MVVDLDDVPADPIGSAVSRLGLDLTPPRPGEFTLGALLERSTVGRMGVQNRLTKAVKAGTMTRRRGLSDGRPCWIYREVK